MVKHGTRIFAVEILWMKVIKTFWHFLALPYGYIQRIYTTILSEIDKAPNQIVYHSQGNPRPPCGKSWEYCRGPVKVSSMTPPCLIKNNVQMHEMTHSTWPTVVLHYLKPTE